MGRYVLHAVLEQGPRQQVALHQADAQVLQAAVFVFGFHPFGNQADVQFAADVGHAADDHLTGSPLLDIAHQCHVQLDDVGLEISQQVQARITGTKVINRGEKADALVFTEDLGQPFAVCNLFAFHCFKHDVLDGKTKLARRLQGVLMHTSGR